MKRTIGTMGLAVVCVIGLGCGATTDDGLPRQGVSGQVTLDGAPLERGQIVFSPAAGAGEATTQTGGTIASGDYRIAQTEGPVPGRYNVLITSPSAAEGDPDDPAKKVTAAADPIPDRYNARTSLQVDVKAGESNRFDFALTTK